MKWYGLFFFALFFTNFSNAQFKEGLLLFEQRKLSEAKKTLELVRKNSPDYYKAIGYLGGIAYLENQPEKAEAMLEEALKKVKDIAEFYYWYGVLVGMRIEKESLLVKARDANKIKTAFEKAISLDEKHLGARWGLMEYYLRAPLIAGGGKEKAWKMAEEIETIDKQQGALAKKRIEINTSK